MALIQGWQEQDWRTGDSNAALLHLTEDGHPSTQALPPPALVPLPVVVPVPLADPVAAAASSAPSPAALTRTPGELAQILAAWNEYAAPDSYRMLQLMSEHGWDAAAVAQATGYSPQEVGDYLTRIGAPAGFGGAVTLGREALNAPFQAALDQARLSDHLGTPGWAVRSMGHGEDGTAITVFGFDLLTFTAWYMAQPQGQAFARVHGAASSDGAGGVQFAHGARLVTGGVAENGMPLPSVLSWYKDSRIDTYLSAPRASDEERMATFEAVSTPVNEGLLQVFGGAEGLPNNEQGEIMRARYGTDLGTLLYRLDHAMQAAKDYHSGELNRAFRGESELGWTTGPAVTTTVYDERGVAHTETHIPMTFSELDFHRALTSRGDDKSRLMAFMYGPASVNEQGQLVVRGEAGELKYNLDRSVDESGARVGGASLVSNLPPGLAKVELASPPKLRDATQVAFIPGVGFVTDVSNVIPPKKKKNWLKTALTIAAVVAVSVFTAGTAAPALLGAMGVGTTTLTGVMMTGAMVGAATSVTSGLLTTGRVDWKNVLKSAVVGGVSAGVMDQIQGLREFQEANKAVQVGARMLAQGALQSAGGGQFKDGVLGGLAQGVGDYASGVAKSLALGANVSRAIGQVSQAVVTGVTQGESAGWNSLANAWATDAISPYVPTPWIGGGQEEMRAAAQDEFRQLERAQERVASHPVDGMADLYDRTGSTVQDDANMRLQEQAREDAAQAKFRESERGFREQSDEAAVVRRGDTLGRLAGADKEMLGRYISGMTLRDPNLLQPGQRLDANWHLSPEQARAVADQFYETDGKFKAERAQERREAQALSDVTSIVEISPNGPSWTELSAAQPSRLAGQAVVATKYRTTVLEDLRIGVLGAANTVDTATSLLLGGAASLFSTDYGDAIFHARDERTARRVESMGLDAKDQGVLGETISLIPQILTTPFVAANNGVKLLNNGESLDTAISGTLLTTGGVVASMALGPAGLAQRPLANLEIAAAISGMSVGRTAVLMTSASGALGAVLSTARDVATDSAISSLTESPASDAQFQPGWVSAGQNAFTGVLGATMAGAMVRPATAWVPLAVGGMVSTVQPWVEEVIDRSGGQAGRRRSIDPGSTPGKE